MKITGDATKVAEYQQRYAAAMHAVQSGVKIVLQQEGMDEAEKATYEAEVNALFGNPSLKITLG